MGDYSAVEKPDCSVITCRVRRDHSRRDTESLERQHEPHRSNTKTDRQTHTHTQTFNMHISESSYFDVPEIWPVFSYSRQVWHVAYS